MGRGLNAGRRPGALACLAGGPRAPLRERVLAPWLGRRAAAGVGALALSAAVALHGARGAPLAARAAMGGVAVLLLLRAELALGLILAASGLAGRRGAAARALGRRPPGRAAVLPQLAPGCR